MNSIAVPELKPARDVPLYHDFRELLDGCAARFGSDIAFQIKTARETKTSPAQYRTRSFLELRADVDALGAALYRRGMESKRFAIIGKNRYEWILGYWAHLCGLGIAVPLDKDLPLEELAQSLTKAKADALYFDLAHMELVEKLKEDPAFDHLQYFCMDEAEGFVCTEQLLAEGYANEEALEAYKALPVDGNALAVILFTSGTSGLAKAVMLSQFNMTHNIWSVLSVEDLRHGDVNMAFLPYHHTFGSTGQTMMTAAGMKSVYCDGLKYIQKNIVEYKVSVFICVPLLIESIYKRIMAEVEKQGKTKKLQTGLKLSGFLRKLGIDRRRQLFSEIHEKLGGGLRYIVSGASPLDPKVEQGFIDLGIMVVQGYGMTETSPVLAGEAPGHVRPGSIGHSMPGVKLRIEGPDEEGVGELVAQGPNMMLGYYEDEEAPAEIFEGGWLHTGDLASADKDGYLSIRGRKKNVIVLKNGKNIYPEEIELLVGALPYVSECLVFGEPRANEGDRKDLVLSVRLVYDPQRIAELRGAINPQQIEEAVEADIEAINERLPHYKRIYRRYLTTEPMEKTTTGKIKRYKQKV